MMLSFTGTLALLSLQALTILAQGEVGLPPCASLEC